MKQTSSRHFHRRARLLLSLLALAIASGLLLTACQNNRQDGSATPSPGGTLTPSPRATRPATLTPTVQPLGSADNPIVLAAVSENGDPQVSAALEETARQVADATGYIVVGRVFSGYPPLLSAMEEGRIHLAWLPPLTYVYASQRGLAEVILLTSHFGVYQYGAQFMANIESGFTPYYDPISGYNSADAATALAQFANRRPCWVEPLSPSGYILPAGLLSIQQIPLLPAVITQSHTATVRSLYIKGVCDFGATFSISGDPRTASAVLDDLPDAMDRVHIIWRTDAVIPNLNVSLLAGMPEKQRRSLTSSLLDIARSADGKALLSYAAGNYQIDEIKPIDNSLYDPLRQVIDALNIDLNDLIGK